MTTPRLELRGVSRVFRGGAGIHDVDLRVEPGQIHAIVGLNGAGKTTLMRVAFGMLRPDAGTVTLDGCDLRAAPPELWARTGHLIEHPLAYGELTARDNLLLAARLHGAGRLAPAMVDAAIAEFGLEPYRAVRVRAMSLGNKHRVGLAAALQHDPGIVVLDEPTNALDPAGVIRLREALERRAASGAGILVSSHHLDEVSRIADVITVINRGRVIGTLPPGGTELEQAFFDAIHRDDVTTGAAA
jgi:ABC-2 type transport system ATP-binding protein